MVAHHLPAVLYCLREDAIIIAQSISIRRQTQTSHGVQEAGSQSAKTSIAKPSIVLYLLKLFNVKAKLHNALKHTTVKNKTSLQNTAMFVNNKTVLDHNYVCISWPIFHPMSSVSKCHKHQCQLLSQVFTTRVNGPSWRVTGFHYP